MKTEGRWTPEQIAERFDEVGVERMGLIDRLEAIRQGGRRRARSPTPERRQPTGRRPPDARPVRRTKTEVAMRFSYAESMIDPAFYLPLARAAEEAGYDSFVVPDSIAYPVESDTTYPFNPDGTREFLDDKPFLEPFSLIPALGAVTSTLRFVTFVMKLPIRHPVLVAKQVASVAVLTGNRFLLRGGDEPVARGLRPARRALGAAGASAWTSASPSSGASRPVATSSTTARCSTSRP